MPAKLSVTSAAVDTLAVGIGRQIRSHRKALGVSATTAAEAAGMSRVTWYRLEKGATSVTLGACLSALSVLGLDLKMIQAADHAQGSDSEPNNTESIPVRVAFADYPQLKQLAWQIHGVDTLSPQEALSLYERNFRHLDLEAMEIHERQLIDALRQVFSGENRDV